MTSRRQHKIARAIRESVSHTIQYRLSDPRITGLVSVTEVDVAPDMKSAKVYLSILTPNDKQSQQTFEGICHAIGPIQHQLGHDLTGKYCPHLHFEMDTKMKKTLQTLKLIERVESEYTEHPLVDTSPETTDTEPIDEGPL